MLRTAARWFRSSNGEMWMKSSSDTIFHPALALPRRVRNQQTTQPRLVYEDTVIFAERKHTTTTEAINIARSYAYNIRTSEQRSTFGHGINKKNYVHGADRLGCIHHFVQDLSKTAFSLEKMSASGDIPADSTYNNNPHWYEDIHRDEADEIMDRFKGDPVSDQDLEDATMWAVTRCPIAKFPGKANKGAYSRSKVMKRLKRRLKSGR